MGAVVAIILAAGVLFVAISFLWVLLESLVRLFWPRPGEDLKSRIWKVVKSGFLSCLVLGAMVALLLPQPCRVREAARRSTYTNNLSMIAKAVNEYQTSEGCLPPAHSVDKDGRALHSWRVLLLPYLGQEELYRKIRLDEPWDSPHNRAVLDVTTVPLIFACPSEDRRDRGEETSYVMIVGPSTISDGPHSVRREDVKDGAMNTIAVVEMSDSGIHWAEPRDLKADEMSYRINDPDQPCIRSRHNGGANVAFCDGSVRLLVDSVPAELVKALTTIAGGEDVSELWQKY